MLSQFYGKAPDLITKQELQDYFLHRKNVDHWSPNTMRICYCGIRFFYEHVLQGNWHILGILRAQTEAQGDEPKGDVGTNANYLSYPPNSVIFSSLEIQFTEAVVISRNRATGAPVYPNFRTVSLVLACPQFTPLRYPVPSFMSLFISLCTNVPTRIFTKNDFFYRLNAKTKGGRRFFAASLLSDLLDINKLLFLK